MKRIGLIDYYINEWHALNYPTFLKNVKDAIDGEFEITDFYAEIDHPDLSSDEYEKQYGVHIHTCQGNGLGCSLVKLEQATTIQIIDLITYVIDILDLA